MRLRYLAATGEERSLDRLADKIAVSRPDLCTHAPSRTLRLWTAKGTPIVPQTGGGAVAVGLLVDEGADRRRSELPSPLPVEELFVRRFWGAYVLLAAPEAGRHSVLRDPSGAVGAYHRHRDGVDLYASDADMLALGGGELSADLEFITQWLTFPFLRTARTGAVGVEEILPGTCRRVDHGSVQTISVWSPWEHTRPEVAITDFEEAAAALREAGRRLPLLVPDGEDVVVELSGGLDSSVLTAALAAGGCSLRAVTFATRSPDGDERVDARALASAWDIPLLELMAEDAPPRFQPQGKPSLRPPANAVLRPLQETLERQLGAMGAGLILGGAGGDNVFAFLNTASPALDAARSGRILTAMLALRDIAELHGCTLWTVAKAAARRARRGNLTGGWPRDDRVLAPGAGAAAPAPHPWLTPPRGFLPGTLEHVRSIVGIHHFLRDSEDHVAAHLHPLLSQPIMEVCLRIPTWLWLKGGRDRAVVREAFRLLLPSAIIERRSKGRLESMLLKAYRTGKKPLETFLLEGRLEASGLIDADAVTMYLRQPGEPVDAGYVRLLQMATAESWLRAYPG